MSEKKNPFVSQVENLPFHNFEEVDAITCTVESRLTLGEAEPFDVYVVNDLESGERKFLTSSYTIEKQIEKAKKDNDDLSQIVFLFVFRGRTVNAQKQPFNQFDVSTCSLQQYIDYMKEEKPKK